MFRTSWDSVFRAVEMAVARGRAHQDLGGVQAIGINEIAWKKGHRYLTRVYQIDQHCKRLPWRWRESSGEDPAQVLSLVRRPAQR